MSGLGGVAWIFPGAVIVVCEGFFQILGSWGIGGVNWWRCDGAFPSGVGVICWGGGWIVFLIGAFNIVDWNLEAVALVSIVLGCTWSDCCDPVRGSWSGAISTRLWNLAPE